MFLFDDDESNSTLTRVDSSVRGKELNAAECFVVLAEEIIAIGFGKHCKKRNLHKIGIFMLQFPSRSFVQFLKS